jgi:hypothetical protein
VIHTGLLETDDICHIGHVDPALQLKARLTLRQETRLIFTHDKFSLLLVWVDILATQKDSLKKEDMVLEAESVRKFLLLHAGW